MIDDSKVTKDNANGLEAALRGSSPASSRGRSPTTRSTTLPAA